MTTATSIVAPPYHVQSTAAELRSGFPYFPYHGSVSALGANKWRMVCQHGIYPFTDAKVEDFDPIFAELVEMSGDDPDILHRPDEYAKPFLPVGERPTALAGQAEQQGDSPKALDLYLRAAAVYRIARFPINRSQVSQDAWEKGKAAYVKAGQHLSPASVAVDMPFRHADASAGDADGPIQAYLRMPKGERPKDGWPVLLFICGRGGKSRAAQGQAFPCVPASGQAGLAAAGALAGAHADVHGNPGRGPWHALQPGTGAATGAG